MIKYQAEHSQAQNAESQVRIVDLDKLTPALTDVGSKVQHY